jgi:hypothetical protein
VKNNPGKSMSLNDMKGIEVEALTRLGIPPGVASDYVSRAMNQIVALGITKPVNIPWGGKNP